MNNPLGFWRGNLANPFDDRQFQRAVDSLFENWAGSRLPREELAKMKFNPSCEVSENKSSYTVRFDLPGVAKDQIKIDLHNDYLTVSGERKEEKKEDTDKRHFSEVYYGSFSRSFSFPTKVDAERAEAKHDAGVLTITIPKAEPHKARQITIR